MSLYSITCIALCMLLTCWVDQETIHKLKCGNRFQTPYKVHLATLSVSLMKALDWVKTSLASVVSWSSRQQYIGSWTSWVASCLNNSKKKHCPDLGTFQKAIIWYLCVCHFTVTPHKAMQSDWQHNKQPDVGKQCKPFAWAVHGY